MINKATEKLLLITAEDGELISQIEKGESFNIRSKLQTALDEEYSPKIQLLKGRFFKTMEKEEKLVDFFKDSPTTYLVLSKLKHHIEYDTNLVKKNGEKYKINEIAQDMGLSRQSISFHINKLKAIGIAKEIKTKRGTFLALNPYYVFKGREIQKKIVDEFSENLNFDVPNKEIKNVKFSHNT